VLEAVVWYACVELIGFASFPLFARAFGALDDRGWAAGKAAGMLLGVWLVWLVASAGLPYTRVTVALAIGALWWALPFMVGTRRSRT